MPRAGDGKRWQAHGINPNQSHRGHQPPLLPLFPTFADICSNVQEIPMSQLGNSRLTYVYVVCVCVGGGLKNCVTMPKAVRSFFHPFWGVRISLSIKLEGRLSGYRNWTCHHIEAIVTTLKFIVSGTAVPAPYFLEIHSGETMSYKIELSRTTTFYPISVDFLKITFSLVLV